MLQFLLFSLSPKKTITCEFKVNIPKAECISLSTFKYVWTLPMVCVDVYESRQAGTDCEETDASRTREKRPPSFLLYTYLITICEKHLLSPAQV